MCVCVRWPAVQVAAAHAAEEAEAAAAAQLAGEATAESEAGAHGRRQVDIAEAAERRRAAREEVPCAFCSRYVPRSLHSLPNAWVCG